MNANASKNSSWAPIFLFIFLVALDQLTKFFLPSVLNSGVALSLLDDLWSGWTTMFLALLLLGFYIFWPFTRGQLAKAVFFAGAVGNFLDRIIFAGVRDCLIFFTLKNNLADYFIVLALIWLYYENYLRRSKHTGD